MRARYALHAASMTDISEDSENFVICLWVKKNPDSSFALRQCTTQISKGWGLQIFTTSAMENWIPSALTGWEYIYINILEYQGAGALDRNKLLRTETFWNQTLGESLSGRIWRGHTTTIADQETSYAMQHFGKALLVMAFGLLGVSGKAALAADPVERALVTCENELTSFCSTVTLGEGRLMMRLGGHEDKVSVGCTVAVYDAAVAIR